MALFSCYRAVDYRGFDRDASLYRIVLRNRYEGRHKSYISKTRFFGLQCRR